MDPNTIKLAPSILAADFARLGDQVTQTEKAGADRIHVDVMDGHFVPNISMGALVVKALRPVTKLPLEVHLMITDPDKYIDQFVKAGADTIIVHVENPGDLARRIGHIKSQGKKAGVVFNPETPAELVRAYVPLVDLVLVMTVHPGFGGQAFMPETLPKVRAVREMIDKTRPGIDLEVDGGIDAASARQAVDAGARVLVAGSSVFGATGGIAGAMERLRAGAAGN